MDEEGIKAFHKIITDITDQDEKIWRSTATKKCFKQEIEKLEEQSKCYELQIETLKKDPFYGEYEKSKKVMEENINEHIQIHKLLSLSINLKSDEIDRKTKDLKLWDKKYAEAISDLKDAYDMKRNLIESINPAFKKMIKIQVDQKIAAVMLKQLKASSTRRLRNKKRLATIKTNILNGTIINFVKAVTMKKNYAEVSVKLKTLEDKKKVMVKKMFETQEALKKHKIIRNNRIPSGMFTKMVPSLKQPGILKENESKRMNVPNLDTVISKKLNLESHNSLISDKKHEANKNNEYFPEAPKRNSLFTNRLNIISNKVISLPPLKTILNRRRSKMENSFNKSLDTSLNKTQNSQTNNSQKENEKFEINSQEIRQCIQNSKEKQAETKIAFEHPPPQTNNLSKQTNYLNNLKFTIQSGKFQIPKTLSFKQNSQPSQLSQKNSILKGQASKRKLNESIQEMDLSVRKKEKNVNFASPIKQNIQMNQTSSSDEPNLSSQTSNINMSGFMNMSTKASLNDDLFNVEESPFNFNPPEMPNLPESSGNGNNSVPMPIFGGGNDAGISFGFSFGGPEKSTNEMWNLFN